MTCAQTVDIGQCETSGTNTTGNYTNYIAQYPKPYRRTDGKWMALGGLIGAFFGGLANQDIVKKAEKAEGDWQNLTDKFKDKGKWLFEEHAEKLTDCTDKLHEMLCKIADCGYKVDYEALGIRVRAIAMSTTELERLRLCRITDRYKIGASEDIYRNLMLGEQVAVTYALTKSFETARKEAFELNTRLIREITQQVEGDQIRRWETGGKYMQIAMQSYSKLTGSYRATAKSSVGDMVQIGTTLAFILPLLLGEGGFFEPKDDCSDETKDDDKKADDTVPVTKESGEGNE